MTHDSYVLGIDIGGTNIVVGAVTEDGSRLIAAQVGADRRPEEGPDVVIDPLAAIARATIAETTQLDPDARLLGVGVGAPGPARPRTGVIFLTPNLGWTNMPLRERIGRPLELPASLDNDANCAMLGEWWVGAARGSQARGLLHHRHRHRRRHRGGRPAGTTGPPTSPARSATSPSRSTGRRCGCGNDGCLEAYASGPAIARRAVEAIEAGAESRIVDR